MESRTHWVQQGGGGHSILGSGDLSQDIPIVGQDILPLAFKSTPRPMDQTARAGLTLVSEAMLALGLDKVVGGQLSLRRRKRGYGRHEKSLPGRTATGRNTRISYGHA